MNIPIDFNKIECYRLIIEHQYEERRLEMMRELEGEPSMNELRKNFGLKPINKEVD